ncbi:response regulator [uncultured Enterovirga sp.]|uniref:response regulator n=1 Tax=uncultured Enterovirga sp. TaxID=2026352 RepID=UPI0035CA5D30
MDPATFPQADPLLMAALVLAAFGTAAALLLLRSIGPFLNLTWSSRSGNGPADHAPSCLPEEAACRVILDNLPDPVVLRDLRGRIVGANRSYTRLSGGPHPAAAAEPVRVTEEALETCEGGRWISWSETPIEIEGRRHRLLTGREVSESVRVRHRLEEARARAESESEAKSRLLATVSHEFRTPLNGILGMTRLLVETGLNAEQTTYANAVRSSAEAFLTLVEEILDFSQIEAGRIDLADEPFEIAALVQGIVELLAPRAQGKGTNIAAFVATDVPRTVRGDADRLRQVLFNLAGNAVKFTAEGGVGIAVERGAGDLIRIVVEDTGPGIAAERAAIVFEEFETGEHRGSGEAGSGLGLAITRRLVDRMGGRMELDSVVGEGSRFRVELALPAASDEDGPALAKAASSQPERSPGAVLILSGSPYEGPYLARTLREAGIEAVVVTELEQALARMAARSFAVLIADHALPDTDARVAASEAHRHGIARSIVLLSPFERRDVGSPHAAGFDAYLVKPVRPRSLFEQLGPRDLAPVATRPAPAATDAATSRGRAVRILLAEDNEINALLAVKALERLGALVEWARDGREAWERAEAAMAGTDLPYDLILMDVRMPGLDGIEVTRRIRAREAEAGRPRGRIVAVTASHVGAAEAELRQAGFDNVLAKPFTFEDLAAELSSCEAVAPLAQAS